jgi:hypothetical protein
MTTESGLPRRRPLQRQGLALRFVLIIGDRRLAAAHHVSCLLDTVVVEFPEGRIRVGLSRLSPEADGGVLLEFRAEYRDDGDPPPTRLTSWQRVLTGRPGALHQREAVLREIAAARARAPKRTVARPAWAQLHVLAAAV